MPRRPPVNTPRQSLTLGSGITPRDRLLRPWQIPPLPQRFMGRSPSSEGPLLARGWGVPVRFAPVARVGQTLTEKCASVSWASCGRLGRIGGLVEDSGAQVVRQGWRASFSRAILASPSHQDDVSSVSITLQRGIWMPQAPRHPPPDRPGGPRPGARRATRQRGDGGARRRTRGASRAA